MGNSTSEQFVDSQYREDSTALLRRRRVMYAQFDDLVAAVGANPNQLFSNHFWRAFHYRRDSHAFL